MWHRRTVQKFKMRGSYNAEGWRVAILLSSVSFGALFLRYGASAPRIMRDARLCLPSCYVIDSWSWLQLKFCDIDFPNLSCVLPYSARQDRPRQITVKQLTKTVHWNQIAPRTAVRNHPGHPTMISIHIYNKIVMLRFATYISPTVLVENVCMIRIKRTSANTAYDNTYKTKTLYMHCQCFVFW